MSAVQDLPAPSGRRGGAFRLRIAEMSARHRSLSIVVGMAIAGQTFYLFTVENLRQFGALKAMGASTATLARMILLQAFTVGITGYGIGIGLATVFGLLTAQEGQLPFLETWPLLLLVFVALLMICTLSALISIIKLARLEPAIVFR